MMSNDQPRESLESVKGELQKYAQRMEGNSASQIQRAIEANRYNQYVPSWLRPVLFPLSIFALFATGLFLFGMLVRHTSFPAPWEIGHEDWIWWNLIHIVQITLTGILYWVGERKYGKMPGIPRGSLASVLVLAALLPILMLALVIASHVFASLQIRRDRSGVWLRSIGGWTKPIIIIGAVELVVLWLTLMLLATSTTSEFVEVTAPGESESIWSLLTGWLTATHLGYLVGVLAIIGLLQALFASVSIISDAAIEEDLLDVTPLLGTLAPLVVLSPVCLYMLVSFMQRGEHHELWLLIFRILAVLWVLMLLIGLNYLVRRWELVHQPFLIMLMGYLMMIPFFIYQATTQPVPGPPTFQQQDVTKPLTRPPQHRPRSPRAIDILRDE